ncbi:MAG: hypothetical protein U0S36_01920 [Candidatus Nanopelagicales bacterium]
MSRLVLIGYWRSREQLDWPDPADFIDSEWDQAERDLVASYLSTGFVPWAAMGYSACRICGRPNGSVEFSDGVYVWPEGLAHYVADHSVRLPAVVVQHIQERLAVFDFDAVDREWWKAMTLGEG